MINLGIISTNTTIIIITLIINNTRQRSNERADNEEKKIQELEEELKVVGNNLQQLEVSEEKAMAREENYQKQIYELLHRQRRHILFAPAQPKTLYPLEVLHRQRRHILQLAHSSLSQGFKFLTAFTYWPGGNY